MFWSSFMLMYKKKLKLKKSQNIRRYFCFLSITDRQISPALIILKIIFWKNNSWKLEILQIFGSWDQEIDSRVTNP